MLPQEEAELSEQAPLCEDDGSDSDGTTGLLSARHHAAGRCIVHPDVVDGSFIADRCPRSLGKAVPISLLVGLAFACVGPNRLLSLASMQGIANKASDNTSKVCDNASKVEHKELHQTPGDEPGPEETCLCLFDVDRTLTARQYQKPSELLVEEEPKEGTVETTTVPPQASCPDVVTEKGILDDAFGSGELRLSQLSMNLGASGCARCHKGIVSAGNAGGDEEKEVLSRQLGAPHKWSVINDIRSPLVTSCADGFKQYCAREILKYYNNTQRLIIDPKNVFLFDDSAVNVRSFAHTGMNAHQVSCSSRDESVGSGVIGLCGATADEVRLKRGVTFC